MVSDEPRYPMRLVVRRTGLKPDLLRAWERRYRAITPDRSEGRRRLYSKEDIERLVLLREAVAAGHRIGDIARLSNQQLSELGNRPQETPGLPRSDIETRALETPEDFLADCLKAVEELNAARLTFRLEQAAVMLPERSLIDGVLLPFLDRLGQAWADGELRVSHEHLASSAVRSLLGRMLAGTAADDAAPLMIVTTPARQVHELGALAAAVVAAFEGWQVVYLGPNLGAAEIASAVTLKRPRVLALSIIYPSDDPMLAQEIELVGRHLPKGTAFFTGGRAARSYQKAIGAAGGKMFGTLDEFRAELRDLRTRG